MYLHVRPDPLDRSAGGLAALARSLPSPESIARDLESIGMCLPGFAGGPAAISSARWTRSVEDLRSSLFGQGVDLGRSAQTYRELDAGLLR